MLIQWIGHRRCVCVTDNIRNDLLVELKEAFYECDHVGSGFIRAHDLGTALRIAGQTPTESDIQELLQDAVLDGEYTPYMVHVHWHYFVGRRSLEIDAGSR